MQPVGNPAGPVAVDRKMSPDSDFVLDAIALPGLFARTRKGWAFFSYAILLSALGKVLSLSLFGLLISALMVWIAFQVKYHYR